MSVINGKPSKCPGCQQKFCVVEEWKMTEVCGFKAKYPVFRCRKCGWNNDKRA